MPLCVCFFGNGRAGKTVAKYLWEEEIRDGQMGEEVDVHVHVLMQTMARGNFFEGRKLKWRGQGQSKLGPGPMERALT